MEIDVEQIVRETKTLIRYHSTLENQVERNQCLDKAIEFAPAEYKVNKFESNGFQSALIHTDPDTDIEILLHGHIDVVGAIDSMFEPHRQGEFLYGRGSADMKGGVACLLEVMRILQSTNHSPSVGLVLVSDEEAGGHDGIKYLIEEGICNPRFALSAEPNCYKEPLPITTTQKGILGVKIRTLGSSCHSARPWEGENAATSLFEVHDELMSQFNVANPNTWKTTAVVSKLDATGEANVIPETASLLLDIRYIPDDSPDQILEKIDDIDNVEYEVKYREPPLNTSSDSRYIEDLHRIANDICGGGSIINKCSSSDMRHFTRTDIPAVVFGPEGYDPHGDEERINISSFENYVKTVVKFILSYE